MFAYQGVYRVNFAFWQLRFITHTWRDTRLCLQSWNVGDWHLGLKIGKISIIAIMQFSHQYKSRVVCRVYGDHMPGHVLNDRIASYMHVFNLYWYTRPFGNCVFLAVWDSLDGPQLYLTEPSGNTLVYSLSLSSPLTLLPISQLSCNVKRSLYQFHLP